MKKVGICLLALLIAICAFSDDWYIRSYCEIGDIEVRVDTLYGSFAIGTHHEGRNMTAMFDRPLPPYDEANHFIVQIGGTNYISSAVASGTGWTDIDPFYRGSYFVESTRTIVSRWDIPPAFGSGDIIVYQLLRPTLQVIDYDDTETPSDTIGTIEISYEIQNTTMFPQMIGLKLLLNCEHLGDIRVGPADISRGSVFWAGEGFPDMWQAYEIGSDYPDDQLIVRGTLTRSTPPCYFGLGNFTHAPPETCGMAQYRWRIFDDESGHPPYSPDPCWIGDTIIDLGTMMRWDPMMVSFGGAITYTTTYGHGARIPPSTTWARLGDTPSFPDIVDCEIDTIVNLWLSVSNYEAETAEDVVICLDLPSAPPGLYAPSPTRCDTLGTLEALSSGAADLAFVIPAGYSSVGTMVDELDFSITSSTPGLADVEITRAFTTPFIDYMPPEVEFINPELYEFINCSTAVKFYSYDSDTTINPSSVIIHFRTETDTFSFNYLDGIFSTVGDTTRIALHSTLITTSHDTLHFTGSFEICVMEIADAFGCRNTEPECITVAFDYDPPGIFYIMPEPASTLEGLTTWIEIAVRDLQSGVYPGSAILSIEGLGEFTVDGSDELFYFEETIRLGAFDFAPSEPYPMVDSILVCLSGLADNVSAEICEPNILADTCWYYYIPPHLLRRMEINAGWNLKAFPYDSFITADDLTDPLISPFHAYNPATRGYYADDLLVPGKGYWLYSMGDTLLDFSAYPPMSELEIELGVGWNLIGGPYGVIRTSSIIELDEVIPPIYGYNIITGEYEEVESLLPSFGYWILARDSVRITIDAD